MRLTQNEKLSEHFSLYEIMEGTAMPQKGKRVNWKNFSEFNKEEFVRLCKYMEHIRDEVNQEFNSDLNNREIGFTVTAGFRAKEWELSQGRSGNSMHTVAALDVQPSNVSKALAVKILDWLYKRYSHRERGHYGGFAIKKPTLDKVGNVIKVGFLHFDLRKAVARWEY
jgi:hypothetical protein